MRALLVTLAAVVLLALPATGSAQTPTDDIYDPDDVVIERSDPAGVPFTGLDVGLVLLAGGALVGTGVAIRRASRSA